MATHVVVVWYLHWESRLVQYMDLMEASSDISGVEL